MNRIKKLRQKRGLSIEQLSNELKKKGVSISPASISKYEREARNPKIENWDALANYFNVSVSYITGASNDPNKNNGRLKRIRNDKDLSLQQVADAYNKEADNISVFNHTEKHINAQTIEKIESGEYQPNQHEWQLLAWVLNVPEFYLAGRSNDKIGWQEWTEATGHSSESLQQEVKRLIDTGRLDKEADIQDQINRAVKSLDFHTLDTTQGVILELENQLLQLKATVSDAFLDIKETPLAPNSTIKVIKPDDIHVKKDMDADAYKAICKLLDETRYKLSEIPIKPEYNQFSKK